MSDTGDAPVGRALALGTLVGMRSIVTLALVSLRAARRQGGLRDTPFAWLTTPPALAAQVLMAVGEIVRDKLPTAGSRTVGFGIVVRIVAGALLGAATFSTHRKSPLPGALLGAAAAVVSAHTMMRLRGLAGRVTHLPDLPFALLEDALDIGLTLRLTEERDA